jgi:hypothetical protein
MKHFLFVALSSLFALPAAAQTKLNVRLRHELDSIYEVDQRYRNMLFEPGIKHNLDSLAAELGVSKSALPATVGGLKQYGYPGKSLVGAPTNEAAWNVIQHSSTPATIKQYLPVLKVAAGKGELPFYRYAMMLDRFLLNEGKEQVYGTQAHSYNGQPFFFWPIQNPAQVNQRRKQAGFTTTVEEKAAQMGIPYRVVTLEDVAKMPKQ